MKDVVETGSKASQDEMYTPYEQQGAETHSNPTAYYSITFAGKEAIFKTLAKAGNQTYDCQR